MKDQQATTCATALPDELWLYIFEHFLTPFQLKTARLVCLDWNRLIRESCKALNGYTFTVPSCRAVVHDFSASRYPTVTIRDITRELIPVLPLATVRVLQLVNPWVTAKSLVELFVSLPNLWNLSLDVSATVFNYELYETMPAVQLNGLRMLDLNIGVKDEFLSIFQHICPSLKGLSIKMFIKKYLEAPYGSKLLEFIRTNRDTLTQVKFQEIEFREESFFRDVMAIEGLKLTQVVLTSSMVRPADVIHLCQSQIYIESLYLPSYNLGSEVLNSIAMNLPCLKLLNLKTDLVDLLPVLSNLPLLHTLTMAYESQFLEMLDLSTLQNPNLQHVTLVNFYLSCTNLLAFFKKSPNIRTLTLFYPSTICIVDIFVIAGQLKDLRKLRLYRTDPYPGPIYFPDIAISPFRKLRELQIFAVITVNLLGHVLENSPFLQHLTLSQCQITDNDMPLLGQFMKNLVTLCFDQLQAIGGSSTQQLVQQCRKLETLTIVNCPLLAQFVSPRATVRVVVKPFLYPSY